VEEMTDNTIVLKPVTKLKETRDRNAEQRGVEVCKKSLNEIGFIDDALIFEPLRFKTPV